MGISANHSKAVVSCCLCVPPQLSSLQITLDFLIQIKDVPTEQMLSLSDQLSRWLFPLVRITIQVFFFFAQEVSLLREMTWKYLSGRQDTSLLDCLNAEKGNFIVSSHISSSIGHTRPPFMKGEGTALVDRVSWFINCFVCSSSKGGLIVHVLH